MNRTQPVRRPMCVIGLIAIAALFVSPVASAQTNVGGPVLADTTWTAAGSPYIVTNALIVGAGATLTIEPGVTVRFNAGLGITVGSQAWGPGALKAIGTADQKITFTSNVFPNQPGQWKDIFFTDFAADAVFDKDDNYVSGSILKHCIVRYAGSGDTNTGAVTINQSAPMIESCEVRDNSRTGIRATNSSGVPLLRIRSCNIHNNETNGQNGAGVRVFGGDVEFTNNFVQLLIRAIFI